MVHTMKEKRILVTGANGFLGRAILCCLPAFFTSIRATDVAPGSGLFASAYVKADITNPEEVEAVLDQTAIVIHAAGLAHVFSPGVNASEKFRQVNEIGTANMAAAAAMAGVAHFVLISSVSIYGGSRKGGGEGSGCYPQGPYAQSKYQAEQRAIEIAEASGMALTILRLATLYGEGDPGNVARLMRSIDQRRFIWVGNGLNRKSLLYIEDAARACLAVIQGPASGVNVYNVSAPSCTMREMVQGLAAALGKRIPLFGIPALLVRGISGLLSIMPVNRLQTLGATAQKWLANDIYDSRKFEQVFNFQAQVNLAEGLRREVAFYRLEQAKRGS